MPFDVPTLSGKPRETLPESTERELTAVEKAFRARNSKERQRFSVETDSEFWVCFCFASREEVEAFQRAAGLPPDKYVNGREAAKKLGVSYEAKADGAKEK